MTPVVNLEEKIKEIGGKPYAAVEVARVNDQVVRMSLEDGEFHWHKHSDEDELFFVYRGEIEIQYRDRPNVRVKEGEMTVVPRGVEHCSRGIVPSYVLLFEPNQVNAHGD